MSVALRLVFGLAAFAYVVVTPVLWVGTLVAVVVAVGCLGSLGADVLERIDPI